MHRLILSLAAASILAVFAGCTTGRKPTTATTMEPKIRAQVEKGIVEPGFTPEMVFMALGKPSEPAESLVDSTANGVWVYRDFKFNGSGKPGREFIRAGYRQRVVSDPAGKGDTVVNEPIDANASPTLPANSLHITFRDGRVVEIQRGVAG